MAPSNHELSPADHRLPPKSGRLCQTLCLLVVAGCGAEEPPIDPATCAAPRTLQIEDVTIPHNNATAGMFAIDLDEDSQPDNTVGMITASVASQTGVELSAIASARLGSAVTWHVTIRECEGEQIAITLAPTSEVGELVHMVGTRGTDGTIVATGDDGALPFATLVDPTGQFADPGWLRARRAVIELQPDGSGRLALALDAELARLTSARVWAPYFDARTEYHEAFDTAPRDGRITVGELEESNLMHALFAPDLDRGRLGISFALGFSAR